MNKLALLMVILIPIGIAVLLYMTAPPSAPGEDDQGEKPYVGFHSGTVEGILEGYLHDTIAQSYTGLISGNFTGVTTFNGITGDCKFTIINGTFTGEIKGTYKGNYYKGELNGRLIGAYINGTVPVAVIDDKTGEPITPKPKSKIKSQSGTWLILGLVLMSGAIIFFYFNFMSKTTYITESEAELKRKCRKYLLENESWTVHEFIGTWNFPNSFKPTIMKFLFEAGRPHFGDMCLIEYSRRQFRGFRKRITMPEIRRDLDEYVLTHAKDRQVAQTYQAPPQQSPPSQPTEGGK